MQQPQQPMPGFGGPPGPGWQQQGPLQPGGPRPMGVLPPQQGMMPHQQMPPQSMGGFPPPPQVLCASSSLHPHTSCGSTELQPVPGRPPCSPPVPCLHVTLLNDDHGCMRCATCGKALRHFPAFNKSQDSARRIYMRVTTWHCKTVVENSRCEQAYGGQMGVRPNAVSGASSFPGARPTQPAYPGMQGAEVLLFARSRKILHCCIQQCARKSSSTEHILAFTEYFPIHCYLRNGHLRISRQNL